MTIDQKLFLIETFRDALLDQNKNSISNILSNKPLTDKFEIDRFLLKDICHLLNQYQKEIIANANQ